jgi:UDP-2,3-diacylglucosamine pyrophosphatase LpxH
MSSFATQQAKELLNHAELVFVSDVHLHGEGDHRARLLMNLIAACKENGVKKFVLGGDIYEFFWARARYFHKKFHFLHSALLSLSKSGCEVYFVQGNHEYCMEEISIEGVKILEADGGTLQCKVSGGSMKVGISHGDLLNAPESYLKFKTFLNSKSFKFFFGLIPPVLADNLALFIAKQSRKKDKYRELVHMPILEDAEIRAQREEESVHIFGHFHYPYQAVTKSGCKLLCVSSWDLPNAIVLSKDEFYRINIRSTKVTSKKIDFKPMDDYQS